MPWIKRVLGLTTLSIAINTSYAAVVPLGTVLHEQQQIARHIKDEPASLDPAKAVGLPEIHVIRDLFEGLVNQGPDGKSIPGVAERWQTLDNRNYLFYLRKNARWSNGDPVTAQDFVYSWRRLADPQELSPFSWFVSLAGLTKADEVLSGRLSPEALGVYALDNHTLKVTLSKSVPYFVSLVANFSLYPVHQATVKKYGNAWIKSEHLVSNGAFRLQERVVNEKLVLVPNPYYWDHAQTQLKKVTFIPINQESTALQRYLAGDIDITESFPKNKYRYLLKILPGQVYTPEQLGTYYYAFNTQRPPLNDQRIRQALSLAIDRQIIADKVLGTGEKPAWNFTPDVTAGFHSLMNISKQVSQQSRNQQAKTLLKQAGYDANKPLPISLLYNTSENNEKIAIAVASMWKKTLGVKVKLTNQEWKSYIDSRNSGNFDVIRASWVGDYNEASTFLSLLTSKHTGNLARFQSKQYDQILNSASQEIQPDRRNLLYNHAEEILRQQAPVAPIYQQSNSRLIKPWVKGYPITNPEDVAYSHQLYIIKH